MGVRAKLMTETRLLKYNIETKHPADRVTAALKASAACHIASSISWREQSAWTNGDYFHSQHYFLPAPQSFWLGLQIALFSIFLVICAALQEKLCSSCDITILASSTFPLVLLLLLLTWVSVTTVYAAWLNLHLTSILKTETKCSFETSVPLLTKPNRVTNHKTSILIHTTHKKVVN